MTISALQNEMAKEQSKFDEMGARLAELSSEGPAESATGEGEQLSERLIMSQGRLAMLMGRNMKCFTQVPSPTRATHMS